MTIVGIDPGLSGAIAVLDGAAAAVFDMPTAAYSKTGFVKRAVDLRALTAILRPFKGAPVFMERVNAFPGQGAASMFSLGMSYWGAAGVVAALGMPQVLVPPQAWKTHFGLNRDKSLSLELARRLFPTVDLHRKKDDGRAEALLIAKYGLDRLEALR